MAGSLPFSRHYVGATDRAIVLFPVCAGFSGATETQNVLVMASPMRPLKSLSQVRLLRASGM